MIYWIKSHFLWQSNDYTRALKSILMSVDFIFSNLPPLCYVLKFEFINLNYRIQIEWLRTLIEVIHFLKHVYLSENWLFRFCYTVQYCIIWYVTSSVQQLFIFVNKGCSYDIFIFVSFVFQCETLLGHGSAGAL